MILNYHKIIPIHLIRLQQLNIKSRKASFVTIKVYDALGKEIVTLVSEEKPAGIHEVNFEPKDLTSGLYLYKIKAGSFEQTRKMLLLK